MRVLRYFPASATLLELLFISNLQEEKLLASQEFLQKRAYTIACGVLDFINSWKKRETNSAPSTDSGNRLLKRLLNPFLDFAPILWDGKARKIVLALRDL